MYGDPVRPNLSSFISFCEYDPQRYGPHRSLDRSSSAEKPDDQCFLKEVGY